MSLFILYFISYDGLVDVVTYMAFCGILPKFQGKHWKTFPLYRIPQFYHQTAFITVFILSNVWGKGANFYS